jgi:ketosteroid isomerase-like protein
MRRILVVLGLFLLSPPPAGAANGSADKEILAAMELWKQGMTKKDPTAFDRVFHADLSYGHSNGAIENKKQATDHVLKSTTVYDAVTFADTKVSVRGDTALVTGKVQYLKHPKDQKVIVQNLVVLSVWVKSPSGWQMRARQSTEPAPAKP